MELVGRHVEVVIAAEAAASAIEGPAILTLAPTSMPTSVVTNTLAQPIAPRADAIYVISVCNFAIGYSTVDCTRYQGVGAAIHQVLGVGWWLQHCTGNEGIVGRLHFTESLQSWVYTL